MAGTDSRVTTGYTRLLVNTPGPALRYPPHTVLRKANQISRRRTDIAETNNVSFLPGDAWSLAPLREDLGRILTTEDADSVIGTSNVNLPSGWTSIISYRKPSDLTGIGPLEGVETGGESFIKRVTAGSSWETTLSADQAALSAPTITSRVEMDRVLSGTKTYKQNTGFALAFMTPNEQNAPDVLLSFYFGGQVPVATPGKKGGLFCLTLFGNGKAELREQGFGLDNVDTWFLRSTFAWAQPFQQDQGKLATVVCIPYGRNTVAFRSSESDYTNNYRPGFAVSGMLANTGAAAIGVGNPRRGGIFYRNERGSSGYVPGPYMTGPGTIRLDVRRDLRTLIKIVRLKPPVSGTLVDAPFWVPFPIPAGTNITVRMDTYVPEGTSITVKLYTMDDQELVPSGTTGLVFESVARHQGYYAVFTFNSDEDQELSPVLYGYSVSTPGVTTLTADNTLSIPVQSASITGPDTFPDQDSASAVIEDALNSYSALRVRARQPAKIALYSDTGSLVSYLFAGEVANARARWRGKPSKTYPSPNWRQYDVSLMGEWARLNSAALNLSQVEYHVDPNASENEFGAKPPWKITDILDDVLEKAGYPSTMRDIPDLPMRLWESDAGPKDSVLPPGANIGEFINRLTQDYLASALVWDPNAGTYGMWRLLLNRTSAGTPLMNFLTGPSVVGRVPTHVNSYSATQTFMVHDTIVTEVTPPEANYVLVTTGETDTTEIGPNQVAHFMYNPASLWFGYGADLRDPTSPDYLDFFCPILHVDNQLATREAAAFVCRRIYDYACHAQKWAKFTAPLVLVTDVTDESQVRERPLRINDPVTVDGLDGLVRSVNPDWSGGGSDRIRMAEYEVLILPS